MFDILQSANKLFGTTAFTYKEILREFTIEYRIRKENLPSTQEIESFLGEKPERDKMMITIQSDMGIVGIGDDASWIDNYKDFMQSAYEDEEFYVVIKVIKAIKEGTLSIYNLQKFSAFLSSLKIVWVFENLTELFKECGEHIVFQLLDTNGALRTNSIVFSDNDVQWIGHISREMLLKNCQDASVFLDRTRIHLIPQDFKCYGTEGTGFEEIVTLFKKMETILSYIYLANTASIVDNKAIIQFDPANKGHEYELEELADNITVPKIYNWAFQGESSVDKAGIARKIIITYCRDRDAILKIDERVLNSVKSDYVIYQKNHVDQYIDMKNRISDYIVDSAEKIQDLSHDIVDAFRNNFVAVIVFLMTVLLTDSIDLSLFFGKEISPRITVVCGIFSIATLLYFIATIIMGNQKWEWLKQSYNDLKKNYEGVFDSEDIEAAFHYDEPLNNAEKQYKKIQFNIGIIWIVLIIVMFLFTIFLACKGYHVDIQTLQADESIVDTVKILSDMS